MNKFFTKLASFTAVLSVVIGSVGGAAPLLAATPVINAIVSQTVVIGDTVTFTATATDEDTEDIVSFALSEAAPDGSSITSGGGVFTWNTTGVVAGEYTFQVTATSGEETVSADVTITVTEPAPVEPVVVNISTIGEFKQAIQSQSDGQTWIINAGNYGFDGNDDFHGGLYLPITANNLTIEGVGNPVIYGAGYNVNGNWNKQNLITIYGNDVVLRGVTLMPKIEANKTIEVLGENFTIEQVDFRPNTIVGEDVLAQATEDHRRFFAGSLLFNKGGSHKVKDVTFYNGGISLSYAPMGTEIEFENVNIVIASLVERINTYRFGSNPSIVLTGLPVVTYEVSESLGNLSVALASAQPGDTIKLMSNITLSSPLVIEKGVVLDGDEFTLTASEDFSGDYVVRVGGTGVTISDLTVDGAGKMVHGIQAYKADNVTLNDVTVQNNGKSGLLVNGSTVTATNLTTSGNGWNGVNVDRGVNVENEAVFTITGTSSHSEDVAIWVDDVNKTGVTVNAEKYVSEEVDWTHPTSQLSFTGRAYALAPEQPRRSGGGSRAVADRNAGEVAGAQTGPEGEVLGASTVVFTSDLTVGSRGAEVSALQSILIASGDLAIAAPTGYFGELTKAALAQWQGRNGVPATGYFGPLTRAALNASTTPVPGMTDTERAALIAELLKKVLELQEQLKNIR